MEVGQLFTWEPNVAEQAVYGLKSGVLVKAFVNTSEQELPNIITNHQSWLKKELGVSSPVFGLINSVKPHELITIHHPAKP